MSPGHHEALMQSISNMPLLLSHRKVLDYDQMSIVQHLVEVLFVIAILLGGRRKLDAQDRLASYGIADTLSKLFDVMDWSPSHRQGQGPHGPGCQCNSKTAPKIQFLRLVHNFSCRDMTDVQHRSGCFTPEEQVHLARISNILSRHWYFNSLLSSSSVLPNPITTEQALEEISSINDTEYQRIACLVLEQDFKTPKTSDSSEDQPQSSHILISGLMNKIIAVLGQANGDSPIKFWLATCVESFIRGPLNFGIQIYVALSNNGTFLTKLVDEIIAGSGAGSGGLQTNFDLLGELIKLNPIVLTLLDQTLGCGDTVRFDAFMQVVRMHLVDSNVLLRSMMLTIEHEEESLIFLNKNLNGSQGTQGTKGTSSTHTCSRTRFHRYLETSKSILLSDMCTTVNPLDVTQENLCCLNSSLVLLIFAHRKNQLISCLNELQTLEQNGGRSGIRFHFRQLLWFWKEYYYNRASDRQSLENSSRIEFSEFSALVSVLTSDTTFEKGSLLQQGSHELHDFQQIVTKSRSVIQNAVDRQRH